MPWAEAIRLIGVLASDPSSHVCASINRWDAPRSREWFLLADLFDVTLASVSKKTPKPYPRPTNAPKIFGIHNKSPEEFDRIMRSMGHE